MANVNKKYQVTKFNDYSALSQKMSSPKKQKTR